MGLTVLEVTLQSKSLTIKFLALTLRDPIEEVTHVYEGVLVGLILLVKVDKLSITVWHPHHRLSLVLSVDHVDLVWKCIAWMDHLMLNDGELLDRHLVWLYWNINWVNWFLVLVF